MKTTTTLEEVYELLERVDDKLSKIRKGIKEMGMAEEEAKPRVREGYLRKLEAIRKGEFVKVKNISEIL